MGVGQTYHTSKRPDVNQAEMVGEAVRAALTDAPLSIKDIAEISLFDLKAGLVETGQSGRRRVLPVIRRPFRQGIQCQVNLPGWWHVFLHASAPHHSSNRERLLYQVTVRAFFGSQSNLAKSSQSLFGEAVKQKQLCFFVAIPPDLETLTASQVERFLDDRPSEAQLSCAEGVCTEG